MFFWKMITGMKNTKSCPKTSLQADRNKNYPNKEDLLLNPRKYKFQRTFSFSPPSRKGSVCIEAALSFSLFLFFMINVLSVIFSFVYFMEDTARLQQKGIEAAAYACMTPDLWQGNEDLIRLEKNKNIKSPFPVLAVRDHRVKAKCVVKPWVGYNAADRKNRQEEEICVYVTEYGTVYHKDRACTYLSLSIHVSSIFTVEEEKNEEGEYYRPCEFCGRNSFASAVYVTSHGNKYHTSMECRGLRRTVRSIPLSEVSGKAACKKCG